MTAPALHCGETLRFPPRIVEETSPGGPPLDRRFQR